MTAIVVDDLSTTTAQRLAPRVQRAALAPFAVRGLINTWPPLRRPWMHGWIADTDGTAKPPKPITPQEEAMILSLPPELQEPARRIVSTPRRSSQRVGPSRPAPRNPSTQGARAPAPPEYTILDTGGVVSLGIDQASNSAGVSIHRSAPVPQPAYLVSIHGSFPGQPGTSARAEVGLDEIGLRWAYDSGPANNAAGSGELNLPLGLLLTRRATLRLDMDTTNAGGTLDSVVANALLVYRHVRMRPQPAPPPELPEAYEGPVSPFIGLDPQIAAAFRRAGFPLDDYTYVVGE